MKRLLKWIVGAAVGMTLTVQGSTLAWEPSPDINVSGYRVYYKVATNASYTITNVVGRLTTNVVVATTPNTLYQAFVTATDTNNLESDPSNMIRYQNFYVNGVGKATALTLGDLYSTNFPFFFLTRQPTNGIITGVAPNVTFNPTLNFGAKDMFVYSSPEMFSGVNVTNYYGVYKTFTNKPPVLLESNP